jgi:hypothetical protein
MQVSATLIAAQQAAREARARLQVPQAEVPKANFAAALEKTAGTGFSALPLKQLAAPAAPQAPAQAQAQASGRLGMHVNIIV